MRVVTFKIRDEELEELDRFAARSGLTRSDVIRKAIKEYIRGNARLPPIRYRIRKIVLT
ncbi:MAG: ribbon-helix-helix protein, CopG family [Desulfurococcales archaeon]|nr:ribbon-helix-helix protein, CopG family [Desulfurococcales archaeon]